MDSHNILELILEQPFGLCSKSLLMLVIHSLYPKLLECFKKNLCLKLSDLFPNWPNQESLLKSNCMDGKRHCQLVWIPNFSQFPHTMTKIITHFNAKIWKLDVKTRLQPNQTIISFYWQVHFGCKIAHWKVNSNPN